ncbi:MAG TPA: glycosyltransferase family 4 protein [Candidatus Limnocylindrales bacterium]
MPSPHAGPSPERHLDDATRLVDARPESRRLLRIALVAPPVLPIPPQRYAGTERVVAALADGLIARGHHVTLFASGDSTAGSETVAVLPSAAWGGRSTGDNAVYGMLAAMAALEQADRFDVVHSHVDVMSLPLARQARVPVLTTFHARLDLPGLYEAVLAFGSAPLVAISESQRRWHPAANWVATIPHGLPLEAMPFEAEPGGYLAVVGRATPEKGIAEAIEVASALAFPLRIAAKALNPAERNYLDSHIRPAIGAGVQYLGEIGPDERDPLLAGARATLMLGAWPEPFGLVAIESLATGTPVIARRAGALTEIVEHGVDGFLVDDLSEAKLAVSLVGELDRARIRERAIARFSVERMVSAYEHVYQDLVDGHERRTAAAGVGEDRPIRRPSSVASVVSVQSAEQDEDLDGRRASA